MQSLASSEKGSILRSLYGSNMELPASASLLTCLIVVVIKRTTIRIGMRIMTRNIIVRIIADNGNNLGGPPTQ